MDLLASEATNGGSHGPSTHMVESCRTVGGTAAAAWAQGVRADEGHLVCYAQGFTCFSAHHRGTSDRWPKWARRHIGKCCGLSSCSARAQPVQGLLLGFRKYKDNGGVHK